MTDSPPPSEPQQSPPSRGRRQGLWILVALLACGLAAILWPPRQPSSLAPTRPALDGDGRTVSIASRSGAVTLVHFWATWCPPCIAEAPSLRRLVADFSSESGLRFVLINVADARAAALELLGDLAPLNLFDPEWTVAHAWGTTQLPETYIVIDGKIVEKFAGSVEWDDPQVRARLRRYLDRVAPKAR